jgi:hypothetical protein
MAGMPYLLLGGFGLWAYRSVKKKGEDRVTENTEDTEIDADS